MSPVDSIYQAALLRFRPIMMTTMAALFGGIPLALATGAGSEFRRPLGVAIVGGLIVSQALTLFTTPVVYLYLDRFSLWLRGRDSDSDLPEPREEPRRLPMRFYKTNCGRRLAIGAQDAILPYKTNSGGCGHGFFFCEHGLAQGLEFQEQVEVDVEVLRQLLLVGGEVREELRVVAEGQGLDHGGVDFGMCRFDFGEGLGMAKGEDVFFDGVDAVDSPGVLRESLCQLDFYHAVGFEGGDIFRDESAVRVGVGFGHEGRLSGDGVAATLEDRALVVERDRFRPRCLLIEIKDAHFAIPFSG